MEIIISFFAVIGICFLIIILYDFIFSKWQSIPVTINLTNMTKEEIENVLSLISTVRKLKAGQILTNNITLIISDEIFIENIWLNSMLSFYEFNCNIIIRNSKDTHQ